MSINFAYRLSDDTELRLLEPRHAEEVYALIERNRDYLGRWTRLATAVQSVDDVKRYIKRTLCRFAEDGSPCCGIWQGDTLVGSIDLKGFGSNSRRGEIGYWLDEAYQGRGLITQACRVLLNHVFGALGKNRVEIRAASANMRSRAVAERLGFAEEGTLRQAFNMGDHFSDSVVYAKLREEWDAAPETLAFAHPLTDDAELRLLLPHYAEEIFALTDKNRAMLRPTMSWADATTSVEHSRGFINHALLRMAEGAEAHWGIWYRGEVAGCIGTFPIDWANKKAEIGYWLGEDFQGKGLMTSAGRAMLAYLFTELGLDRAELRARTDNVRSRGVAERLGFSVEGIQRKAYLHDGQAFDMVEMALLREEWESQ